MVRAVALAAVLLAWVAAPAPANLYTLAGEGKLPDVAVDAAGTSHVVWELERPNPESDALVYCRVPRGAASCATQQTFVPPGTESGGDRVLLSRTGQIVLVSWRICCFESGLDTRVYAQVSDDGGTTFSTPQALGDFHWGAGNQFDVEIGPGDFAISMAGGGSGGESGLIYQALPFGEFTESHAKLAGFPKAYYPSIAFPDPTTPMVAYTDQGSMFLRRWSGQGSQNDPARWELEQALGPGDETRLAHGPKGVFLFYEDASTPRRYQVERYGGSESVPADATGFGPPFAVSDSGTASSIFGDFAQDPSGTLHVAWRKPALHHRISRDGNETWDPPEQLATAAEAEALFNLDLAANAEGLGAVVADANGRGPIRFAPFGPTAAGGGGCTQSVAVGKVEVRATTGCFKKKGALRVAAGPVTVGGLDVRPVVSGDAKAAAAFTVTVDPKARTVEASQNAEVLAGNVLLDRSKVRWRLPKGTGKIQRLGGGDATLFPDVGKFGKSLLSFAIDGDSEAFVTGSGLDIPVSFRLPALLGGVTAEGTLRTGAQGLVLQGLELEADTAAMGPLLIKDIDVTYSGGLDEFEGSARFLLPPAYQGGLDPVGFGFREGQLQHAEFTAVLPEPLPLWPPLVSLESIGLAYEKKPDSRVFSGGLALVLAKKIAGVAALRIDAQPPGDGFSAEFPAAGPATFRASGTVEVVSIPLAGGFVEFRTDGLLKFGGGYSIDHGPFSATLTVPDGKGFVDLSSGAFSAQADVVGCMELPDPVGKQCAGGTGIVSSKGVAACVSILGDDYGVGFSWGGSIKFPFCGLSQFKVSAAGLRRAQEGFTLAGGLTRAVLEVEGTGGPPAFVLTAPDGETVDTSGAPQQGRFTTYPDPQGSSTVVHMRNPAAGVYRLTPKQGAPPVARVMVAEGLPPTAVRASVAGSGHRRSLSYRTSRGAGESVAFAERAGGAFRQIGTARSATGRIAFRPASGPAGRREIVALIEQDGLPRETRVVATYSAPAPVRLPAPRVRVSRRGSRLAVAWSRVSGATGYRVRVDLPRDGRRLLFTTSGKRTAVAVKGIEAEDSGRVSVTALGADARIGRAGRASLRPARGRR